MLSRDLDSRPTRREVAAVEEWLDSSKAVHIMRDHPSHKAAIMAGMWGAALAARFPNPPFSYRSKR